MSDNGDELDEYLIAVHCISFSGMQLDPTIRSGYSRRHAHRNFNENERREIIIIYNNRPENIN